MSDLNQIDLQIEEAKEFITARDQLLKLQKNKEFKAIMNTGYFNSYAAKLVKRRAFPQFQDAETQKAIDDEISAIGNVQQYFSSVIAMGNESERIVQVANDERDLVLAEDGE